jgi:hypothetical protein
MENLPGYFGLVIVTRCHQKLVSLVVIAPNSKYRLDKGSEAG